MIQLFSWIEAGLFVPQFPLPFSLLIFGFFLFDATKGRVMNRMQLRETKTAGMVFFFETSVLWGFPLKGSDLTQSPAYGNVRKRDTSLFYLLKRTQVSSQLQRGAHTWIFDKREGNLLNFWLLKTRHRNSAQKALKYPPSCQTLPEKTLSVKHPLAQNNLCVGGGWVVGNADRVLTQDIKRDLLLQLWRQNCGWLFNFPPCHVTAIPELG